MAFRFSDFGGRMLKCRSSAIKQDPHTTHPDVPQLPTLQAVCEQVRTLSRQVQQIKRELTSMTIQEPTLDSSETESLETQEITSEEDCLVPLPPIRERKRRRVASKPVAELDVPGVSSGDVPAGPVVIPVVEE